MNIEEIQKYMEIFAAINKHLDDSQKVLVTRKSFCYIIDSSERV